MNLGLDDRVVLVTGRGAVIGGAISTVLAEEAAVPAILAAARWPPRSNRRCGRSSLTRCSCRPT